MYAGQDAFLLEAKIHGITFYLVLYAFVGSGHFKPYFHIFVMLSKSFQCLPVNYVSQYDQNFLISCHFIMLTGKLIFNYKIIGIVFFGFV